jgi:hypothetical protein
MSEANAQTHEPTLPPEMYRGGFRDEASVIGTVIDRFGLSRPLTIYYPGSSSDVSLLDIPEAHIIHADDHLDEAMLHGFSALGAEAHNVDVHSWHPPDPVDLVAFVNPTGIAEGEVLAHTELQPRGIVLWYSWSGRPRQLQDDQTLELVGAVTFGEEEGFSIDTGDLQDYFVHKSFGELDGDEQQSFIANVDAFMKRHGYEFTEGSSYATAYSDYQAPGLQQTAREMGVGRFPYRKEGSCFIYQKAQGEQT